MTAVSTEAIVRSILSDVPQAMFDYADISEAFKEWLYVLDHGTVKRLASFVDAIVGKRITYAEVTA